MITRTKAVLLVLSCVLLATAVTAAVPAPVVARPASSPLIVAAAYETSPASVTYRAFPSVALNPPARLPIARPDRGLILRDATPATSAASRTTSVAATGSAPSGIWDEPGIAFPERELQDLKLRDGAARWAREESGRRSTAAAGTSAPVDVSPSLGSTPSTVGAEAVTLSAPAPIPTTTPLPPASPSEVGEGRWIDVNLTHQLLTAYEGHSPVRSVAISTGLPGTPTPVGQFRVWVKFRYDDMEGPGYYLPDVPYTMYFYGGYGLHGTYWHSNFGHPMSHGCVNLPTPEAEWLFSWAEVGTLVNVHN